MWNCSDCKTINWKRCSTIRRDCIYVNWYIINPVVLFATYVAFGGNMHMVWYRSIVAIIVAIIVGIILSFMFKEHQLRDDPSRSE